MKEFLVAVLLAVIVAAILAPILYHIIILHNSVLNWICS